MKNSLKFSRIDLLALAFVACILLGVLSPVLFANPHGCHFFDKTTRCADNLRAIGQAMYIYAQDEPSVFPCISRVRTENDGLMRIFDPLDRITKPSTTGVPSPTVDMWTVLRSKNVTPEHFICPFTMDEPDPAKSPADYYDFLGPANLSYAYQFQHDPNRRTLGTSSEPAFPLMADANPYIKGGITDDILHDRLSNDAGNSDNHKKRRDGQNVLYVDSHVGLETTPAVGLSGMTHPSLNSHHDNIYTVYDAGGLIDPGIAAPTAEWCNLGGKSDACLVP